MFGDGALSLREFAMNEPLPLARIHEAVLEFMRKREDAAVFGAQAVNAYVDEPRMTLTVNALSTRAAGLADELRQYLGTRFHIAVRVREVVAGQGFRVFQLRQPKNRHLADVRQIDVLPPTRFVADIRVPTPEELIAQKVIAYSRRRDQPKGGTDRRDPMLLLLACPHLKVESGLVFDRLCSHRADEAALAAWRELVDARIEADDTDDGF